ncbi:hypothetical protein FB45DRAFT_1065175 [Roridomyces roridus]|uniref:Uncharacterized protein n=1 Tax=Roridomyces roridus TaxID=1738132 RepID=A0AAD7FD45_9AGAR|nr:hypothetical protein FB45DRAFT_1065175 [Roridomyces roridus]
MHVERLAPCPAVIFGGSLHIDLTHPLAFAHVTQIDIFDEIDEEDAANPSVAGSHLSVSSTRVVRHPVAQFCLRAWHTHGRKKKPPVRDACFVIALFANYWGQREDDEGREVDAAIGWMTTRMRSLDPSLNLKSNIVLKNNGTNISSHPGRQRQKLPGADYDLHPDRTGFPQVIFFGLRYALWVRTIRCQLSSFRRIWCGLRNIGESSSRIRNSRRKQPGATHGEKYLKEIEL